MRFVARDTNFKGGVKFEIDADFYDGFWHFKKVGSGEDIAFTKMDDSTFHSNFECCSNSERKFFSELDVPVSDDYIYDSQ